MPWGGIRETYDHYSVLGLRPVVIPGAGSANVFTIKVADMNRLNRFARASLRCCGYRRRLYRRRSGGKP